MLVQTLKESWIALAGGLCGLALVHSTALGQAEDGPTRPRCAIMGDSIALGLVALIPGCAFDASVGRPSSRIHGATADFVILSAGSNDPLNPRLETELLRIRRTTEGNVIWIVPTQPRAAGIVRRVAAKFGDIAIIFKPGRDGIHPASYPKLKRMVLDAESLRRGIQPED